MEYYIILFFLGISLGNNYSNTDFYEIYKNSRLKDIFLEKTFITSLDPCTKVKYKYQYIKFLESIGVECYGEWCIDGRFNCDETGLCYNMMHIIDPKKSYYELNQKYNRNILGNLIMAYGPWVTELKGKSWSDTKQEKIKILGDRIFNKALENVRSCFDTSIGGTLDEAEDIYKHTDTYRKWKNGQFSKDFFIEKTFLGDNEIVRKKVNFDPCRKIKYRYQYTGILEENNISCEGDWCNDNGGYSCKQGDNKECYNMEHIVDIKNSLAEFDDTYDREILGNLVMAYGRWNQELGSLKDWESIKNEKSEIYGYIFDEAVFNIMMCRDKCISQNTPNESTNINLKYLLFIIGCGILFGIIVLLYTFKKSNLPKNDIELNSSNNEI